MTKVSTSRKRAHLQKRLHHSPDQNPWSHQRAISSSWTARTSECSDWTPLQPGHSPTEECIMKQRDADAEKERTTKKHFKVEKMSALLAGIWCRDQRWLVLWDCRLVELCIPYSGLLYRGPASLCRFQSSLAPVQGGEMHKSQAVFVPPAVWAHRHTQQMF